MSDYFDKTAELRSHAAVVACTHILLLIVFLFIGNDFIV